MKIAIVGGGISGLVTAYLLSREHEITLYETNSYLGGHTNTVAVALAGESYRVDTGFIVFNERTYPNFIKLLDLLNVKSQPSVMSFGVSCEQTGLEYSATNPDTLFSQRKNILSIPFWKMLFEILKFNRTSAELLKQEDMSLTVGEFLDREGYSSLFIEKFLIPMGAAIWSSDPRLFRSFPAVAFVRFFTNHGLLNVVDQPVWRVVSGGSSSYVEPLARPFRDRVRLGSPVLSVRRFGDRVELTSAGGELEIFDQVVMACHSDQSLAILSDASDLEKELLGAIPYQANDTVLHTDTSLMPSLPRAWSSWNCRIPKTAADGVMLTYWMNRLQSLTAPVEFLVSLNSSKAIDPEKVLRRISYDHPLYSAASFTAQKRRDEINGSNRTWFCGAYWGYGFHEDGVKSALAVCKHFGRQL